MRSLLIGILLAGVAASPALAQDSNDGRWHHGQQQGGHGDGHQQRQQGPSQAQPQQPQAQQPQVQQPQVHEQQQARGPRFGGGNFYRQQPGPQAQEQQRARGPGYGGDFYRQQQAPQFVREQQQIQVPQGQPGETGRRRFEGRPNVAPQGDVRQQSYGYRGPVQVERDRNGGWTRTEGYRGGVTDQQRVRNGGSWYGQRDRAQQQYRDGRGYAGNSWNRDWRNDRRYDWRRYRDNHRSVFHLGLYIDPFGYGYQPYSIGYELPPVYFGEQYWIDPAMYELPYPPPGTQWVRYWNDALLVDMYTGQVVDVIQGFFW